MSDLTTNFSKLKWACRRGMLELDVLLNAFVEEKYAQLTPEEKTHFADLLTNDDPELFDWLLGYQDPAHAELNKIVVKIREHARQRIQSQSV